MGKVLTALRVLAGLAVIGAGIWVFVRGLPQPHFLVLYLFLSFGFFVVEAPRMLGMLRQRQTRMRSFAEKSEVAQAMADRATRFKRWSWVCYAAAFLWLLLASVFLDPSLRIITFGGALVLVAVGFCLGFYEVWARAAIDIRSLRAANPRAAPARAWMVTIGLFALIVAAIVAEKVWRIDAMNWLFGALTIMLIFAIGWRWIRGWPDRSIK